MRLEPRDETEDQLSCKLWNKLKKCFLKHIIRTGLSQSSLHAVETYGHTLVRTSVTRSPQLCSHSERSHGGAAEKQEHGEL